jgi:hypothetical protein
MAFLLVAGVIFILAQTMGIVGTRSTDTSQQLDSTAALMLAESGLQRAEAIVGRSGNSGIMAEADCTGVATASPSFTLGRGSFSYSTTRTVAAPPGCTEGLCTGCTVNVTGTVGSASRTLEQTYTLGVSYGVAGRGTTVTMVLRNIHNVPATSLFNLAWKRQDPGGNADTTFCANDPTGCGLQWNLESSNGNTSVGGMGVTVDIAPNTVSRRVVQTISQSRDYVEVGGLFPSVSATTTPTVTGAFWDDKHVTHLTGVNAGSTGGVVNGVATTTSTCTPSPTTYPSGGTGSFQADTCTSWCSASDTLVYGISGRSQTSADQLTAVTFGTNGPNPSALTKLVHFPNLDGSTPNASGKAFSEVWYLFNPDYLSVNADYSNSAGLTSYPSAVKATAGANPVLNANLANGDTTMTVVSLADSNTRICQGDTLSGDSDINGATITSPAGCGTTGTYTFSPAATGNVNKNNVVVSSTHLRVIGSTGANLQAGTANVRPGITTVSIASGPSGGEYTLSSAVNLGGTVYVTQGASSTTIRVPAGTVLPSSNPYVSTTLTVFGVTGSPVGAGAFPAGTKVVSVGVDSFTVSAAPSTGLYGAKVCGGLCAFFNSPSSTSAITDYSVTKSGGTLQFAGGFVCLRGVDYSKIAPITSTTLKTGRWQETIQ